MAGEFVHADGRALFLAPWKIVAIECHVGIHWVDARQFDGDDHLAFSLDYADRRPEAEVGVISKSEKAQSFNSMSFHLLSRVVLQIPADNPIPSEAERSSVTAPPGAVPNEPPGSLWDHLRIEGDQSLCSGPGPPVRVETGDCEGPGTGRPTGAKGGNGGAPDWGLRL